MEDKEFLESCLLASALHEAGHVVVNLHYKSWPDFATIEPTEEHIARVHSARLPYTYLASIAEQLADPEALLRQYSHSACAGAAAEIIREGDIEWFEPACEFIGRYDDVSISTDFGRLEICINLILKRQGNDDPEKWPLDKVSPFDVLFEELFEETIDILKSHWASVEAIEQALLKHKTLDREQLLEIYEGVESQK